MTRNEVLCRLLRPDRLRLPPPEAFEQAVDPSDALLAAMCLARAGEVRRFELLLPAIDAEGMARLSRYCLLLGLAADPKGVMLLFDAMRHRQLGMASLWIDLALLQAAWGYSAQALRSLALSNALAGRSAPIEPLPDPVELQRPGGAIHFLPGNERRFYAT